MTAFPKADIQNAGIGHEFNVRLWPEADVRPAREPLRAGHYTSRLAELWRKNLIQNVDYNLMIYET